MVVKILNIVARENVKARKLLLVFLQDNVKKINYNFFKPIQRYHLRTPKQYYLQNQSSLSALALISNTSSLVTYN